jgi:hypothetical protein
MSGATEEHDVRSRSSKRMTRAFQERQNGGGVKRHYKMSSGEAMAILVSCFYCVVSMMCVERRCLYFCNGVALLRQILKECVFVCSQ